MKPRSNGQLRGTILQNRMQKRKKHSETGFAARVRAAVKHIPRGQTRTYGEVARTVGHPGAARAVGTIMKSNYDPSVPCHRVVRSDGRIGNYNRGGAKKKLALLRAEGVAL